MFGFKNTTLVGFIGQFPVHQNGAHELDQLAAPFSWKRRYKLIAPRGGGGGSLQQNDDEEEASSSAKKRDDDQNSKKLAHSNANTPKKKNNRSKQTHEEYLAKKRVREKRYREKKKAEKLLAHHRESLCQQEMKTELNEMTRSEPVRQAKQALLAAAKMVTRQLDFLPQEDFNCQLCGEGTMAMGNPKASLDVLKCSSCEYHSCTELYTCSIKACRNQRCHYCFFYMTRKIAPDAINYGTPFVHGWLKRLLSIVEQAASEKVALAELRGGEAVLNQLDFLRNPRCPRSVLTDQAEGEELGQQHAQASLVSIRNNKTCYASTKLRCIACRKESFSLFLQCTGEAGCGYTKCYQCACKFWVRRGIQRQEY